MSSLAREARDLVKWAAEQGWTYVERNSRYILRHELCNEPIFVGANPHSRSAIPNARSQIMKRMKQFQKPPEVATVATSPPLPVQSQPEPEAIPMAVRAAPSKDDDIIRDYRDDIETKNLNYDRFKIGKRIRTAGRKNELIITGKNPFLKYLYCKDVADPNGPEIELKTGDQNSLISTPPLEKFAVGKSIWDCHLVKWRVDKMDPLTNSVTMSDQLGVKKTFTVDMLDDLRTSRDGAIALQDKMKANGNYPINGSPATARPFADAFKKPELTVVQATKPETYEDKWRKTPEEVMSEKTDTPTWAIPDASPAKEIPLGMVQHELLLRKGMKVDVLLPEDFNLTDSTRLCRLIEALAFD